MADGSRQFRLDIDDELIVDLFAGGGGMSVAIEEALGRHSDIAVNHNDAALSMHRMNHPQTRHFCADVYEIDPRAATRGRPVGHLHLSPDCTHFSQAKGGQPRSAKIRGLSWVGVRWAAQVRPRCISLENVKQLRSWGPLVAKRDKATGRVIRLDGTVAAPGERVPVQQQFLIPDPKRAGETWRRFLSILRGLGYEVEHRVLVAADYGAPTTRARLFLFARCDGEPIVWPQQTHYQKLQRGQKKWRAAAECIDWSIPCPSIFGRKRPLADATLRRIARGLKRYVIDAATPYIVNNMVNNVPRPVSEPMATVATGPHKLMVSPQIIPATHGAGRARSVEEPIPTITAAHRGEQTLVAPYLQQITQGGRVHDIVDPLNTITTAKGGEQVLVAPILAGVGGRAGDSEPRAGDSPLYTITAKADTAIVAPTLLKIRGDSDGGRLDDPLPTITSGAAARRPAGAAHAMGVIAGTLIQSGFGERKGQAPRTCDPAAPLGTIVGSKKHAAVVAFLAQQNTMPNGGIHTGHDVREPISTITNTGSHQNVVAASLAEYQLSPEQQAGALRVAAFLVNYYGNGQPLDLRDPSDTITTKDRLALVTVWIKGYPYVIVDIGLRMLTPRELYLAQGFPASYEIERGHDGRVFTKSQQVRMVGNSVSPPCAAALLRANHSRELRRTAA